MVATGVRVRACMESGDKEGSWRGSQGEALAPQPSPMPSPAPTFKLHALRKVEIRDALWQVLDIP